jgi:anti-anti-sigma factor
VTAAITHYVTRVREGFVDGICVIKVDGRLTIGEASQGFRAYVEQQISDGHRNFILDLTDLVQVDSTGISDLAIVSTRARMRTGKIVVVTQPKSRVTGALIVTKLVSIFETVSTMQDALAKFDSEAGVASTVEYKEKYSVAVEKDKHGEKLVVNDNISNTPGRTEYRVRKIPPDNDNSKRLNPASLIIVVFVALVTLGLTIAGLVWAAKVISSVSLLILIFTLALLIFILLCSLVLLLSGHLSEKTTAKLFGTILGKLPGLNAFLPKRSGTK